MQEDDVFGSAVLKAMVVAVAGLSVLILLGITVNVWLEVFGVR